MRIKDNIQYFFELNLAHLNVKECGASGHLRLKACSIYEDYTRSSRPDHSRAFFLIFRSSDHPGKLNLWGKPFQKVLSAS
jgi:hypothetical protein